MKVFNYDKFPKLKECYRQYQRLLKRSDKVDEGVMEDKFTDEQGAAALGNYVDFERNVLARVIYETFKGKGIKYFDDGKPVDFDKEFKKPFDKLKDVQRLKLVYLLQPSAGYMFPDEYYIDTESPQMQ